MKKFFKNLLKRPKRIVRVTTNKQNVRYECQYLSLFNGWQIMHTCIIDQFYGEITLKAVFNSLEEAKVFLEIPNETDVLREVLIEI